MVEVWVFEFVLVGELLAIRFKREVLIGESEREAVKAFWKSFCSKLGQEKGLLFVDSE